jgi:hypothetical protein
MMTGKTFVRLLTGVLMLVSTAVVLAAEVKGTISKVADGGKEISVKGKDGKEVAMSVSGSRTKLEGVADRSGLKVGQKVTAEHDGGEAKKVSINK